jgi:hypothetical protein
MADLCNPKPCDIQSILAGTAGECGGSLIDPSNLEGETMIFDLGFKDLINNFGVTIEYYVNGYNKNVADNFYGEHTLAEYSAPVQMKSYVELTEPNVALMKWGFDPQDELIAYLHIDSFYATMSGLSSYAANNQRVEPKSGDLIKLSTLGCDRPGDRGPKIFVVTERTDQDVSKLNPLLGHYVWRLNAKRYTTSHETNAPQESGEEQVYENPFAGKLSSTIYPTLSSEPKSYPGNVDESSKTEVLDMRVDNTSVYGTYY